MPIPKPNEGESQKDYISRCMGNDIMNKEYPDQSQRSDICYSTWREHGTKGVRGGDRGGDRDRPLKAKINTVDLDYMEIVRAGEWDASTGSLVIKESDLDDIVKNFKDKILEPYVNLNHDDKISEKVKDSLKVVNIGLVKDLIKKGKSLYASFKSVPEKIANLIKSGNLKFRSVEFFKNLKSDGKEFHNVLKAVSFFGANVPAISGLEDIILQNNDDSIELIKFKEVKNMEIEKKEYEELVKAKAQLEIIEVKLKSEKDVSVALKKELEDTKTENKKLKNEKSEVEKMKADYEKEKKADLEKIAGDYINNIIGEGKILPKFKDAYIKDYIVKAKESEDSLKLFKEDIESRGKVVDLSHGETPKESEMTVDTEDYSHENLDKNMDKLNKAIELKMKELKNKGETGDLFTKARELVMEG